MKRRSALVLAALAALLGPSLVTPRASGAALSGAPTAAERSFVDRATAYLNATYPTPAKAIAAGYLRFTNEDDTGAISYANRHWVSTSYKTPSQLWYDVHGRLLGADYSVLDNGDPAPHRWGLAPARWQTFDFHVHYGLVGPNGTTVFGATSPKRFRKIGADPVHPTAADLVRMGIAKSTSEVRFVFPFLGIWDTEIWVDGNPSGAFAESDPRIKPSKPPKSSSM